MKDDEKLMNNVVQYLDSLVTTINPGLDVLFSERHPCQKHSDELHKLQRHTRCNPSYCLRVNHIGQ